MKLGKPQQELVENTVALAIRITAAIARRVPQEQRHELESAAMLGLVEAAARFDPMMQTRFEAFAAKRVRGAVLDELRRQDPLGRCQRRALQRITRAESTARARMGPGDLLSELTRVTGMSAEEIDCARVAEAAAQRSPQDAADLPSAESSALANLEQKRRFEAAQRGIERLGKRERGVLESLVVDERSLTDVACSMGVSPSRVCQLRSSALAKIRLSLPV